MSDKKKVTKLSVKPYEREIQQQDIVFTCTRCGKETHSFQYPGRTPLYCENCRVEVQREQGRERQRRYRENQSK